MKFYQGAPVFAVEVRSEGDYGPEAERRMLQKRADYFAVGTLVVWDVVLLSADVVRVYNYENHIGKSSVTSGRFARGTVQTIASFLCKAVEQ